MKRFKYIISAFLLVVITTVVSSFNSADANTLNDEELMNTIVRLDSLFFTAYNNCDLETQAVLIAEDLEFYHDKGGLSTSKSGLIEALKNNICGKVTRELVKGSIEVSPIPGYGAVQLGMHKFYNNQEPDAESKPSRFVNIWKQDGDSWQMTRVISLHN